MENTKHFWKNIGFLLATLLLWGAVRFLYIRVFGGSGHKTGFVPSDIEFIFLPPVAAFFLNWRWMRDQRVETMMKWSISWAGVDLAVLFLIIFFLGDLVNELLLRLQPG
jgi:hypothetical protein